jgi:hypothetical protein
MAPNRVVVCPLYVDTSEYLFGIPTKKAFAINDIPHGITEHEFPRHLKPASAKKSVSEWEAESLLGYLSHLVEKAAALHDSDVKQKS